jgi:tetratricopeptide (TPR) repeat protein
MSRSLYLVPRPQTRAQPPVDLQAMCGNAIQFHQRGQLAQAEQIYRQILDLDPHHSDSLHLLGVLAHQVGRNDVAVELIRKAIAIDKRPAAYHSNLGTALQALGRWDEAAASYQRALDRNPDMAEAHMNLGAVFEAQGKHQEAETRFRQALALRPDLAEAHVNLGNILQAQGKLEEAATSHERALALKPDFAEASFNLGNTRLAQGKLNEAIERYQKALVLKPELAEVHANLGNALLAQQKPEEAVACYERALALKPDYAEACYNLGNARQAQDKLNEAVACYQRALALKPQLPEAHYNLGNTRQAQDNLEEAAACYNRALALRPAYAEAHYNLGCVLQQLGSLDEALTSYARAIELKPDYAQARFGHALAQLLAGNLAAGWRNYESRWQSPDHDTPIRSYPQPLWRGEKLASGNLLLWGEQGIGDEIMFAGLVPDAIATGNRILLDCDPRLKPLFARSFPEIEIVSGTKSDLEIETVSGAASGLESSLGAPSSPRSSAERVGSLNPQPAAARLPQPEFAAHLSTGSLPGLFRTSEAAFASTSPYLKADLLEQARLRARYNDGRQLIGLAWHTRNQKTGRKRSISLEALAPLFAQAGIRFISLQYGDFNDLEAQVQAFNAPILIDRSVDQFINLDRFAAQIAAMDQVITIDNSTAHLAGALGVPVWLLLPFAADWRWQQARTDTPWYPTMRLFRQPKPGDWQSVIDAVQSALASN